MRQLAAAAAAAAVLVLSLRKKKTARKAEAAAPAAAPPAAEEAAPAAAAVAAPESAGAVDGGVEESKEVRERSAEEGDVESPLTDDEEKALSAAGTDLMELCAIAFRAADAERLALYCAALQELRRCAKSTVVDADWLEALPRVVAPAFSKFAEHVEAVTAAAGLLGTRAAGPEHAKALLADGGRMLRRMFAAMETHQSDQTAQFAFMGTLYSLLTQDCQPLLHKLSVEGAVVRALRMFKSDVMACVWSLGVLVRMFGAGEDGGATDTARVQAIGSVFVSKSGVPALLEAMRALPESPEVQRLGSSALSILAMVDAFHAELISCDALPVIMHAMASFAEHPDVQRASCNTLLLFCLSGKHMSTLLRASPVKLAVRTVKLNDERCSPQACAVLAAMSDRGASQQVVDADGVAAVLQFLTHVEASPRAQVAGVGVLTSLAQSRDGMAGVCSLAVVKRLVKVLRVFSADAVLCRLALAALYGICKAVHAAIAAAGGVAAIVHSIRSFPSSQEVVHYGLGVLWKMTMEDNAYVRDLLTCDAVRLVAATLPSREMGEEASAASWPTQTLACGILKEVASTEEGCALALQLDVLPNATRAINASIKQHQLVDVGLALLLQLAKNDEGKRDIALRGGVRMALQTMKAHNRRERVVELSCALLAELVVIEDPSVAVLREEELGAKDTLKAAKIGFPTNARIQSSTLAVLDAL